MPEKHYFPPRLTIRKLIEQGKSYYPNFSLTCSKRLFKKFKLDPSRKYDQLSRGHQSIFRIVIGLASRAPITIFDEPVLGLDAVARDQFYQELIEEFSNHPRLFIISTHLIEESADLFNEAIIIKDGRIINDTDQTYSYII